MATPDRKRKRRASYYQGIPWSAQVPNGQERAFLKKLSTDQSCRFKYKSHFLTIHCGITSIEVNSVIIETALV